MTTPFVILSLPRSRSAWLARFLTHGDWLCGHEEIIHCRSLDDVTAWLGRPCTGSVETAAAPFWRLLLKLRPDARVVLIRRPVAEVVESMMALDLGFDRSALNAAMLRLNRKLDQIERRVPGAVVVDFAGLADEQTCARLFEHCLPYKHDAAWWAAVSAINIQIDMGQLLRTFRAYEPQLAKLAKVAKHRMISGMGHRAEIDGITFQREPFRSFYRDARPLFEEHLVQTGQSPDDHGRKNLPLLQALDDMGALQCLTARSRNGRMDGYLMSVIGPSLDDPDVIQAEHTIFFASSDVPGLGMKLQRVALDALRERGVHEVLMRAGHRGSGPRLGTFYRRLGAEPFGELYRLPLEN